MSRKLTIQEAEARFPDMVKGQVWKGVDAKYDFECKHGAYSQSFYYHNIGQRCQVCGIEKRSQTRLAKTKKKQNLHPDMVLGQVWKGIKAKYQYRCLKGHGPYEQEFYAHETGQRCPVCAAMKRGCSQKLTIETAEKRHPDLKKGQTWANARALYDYVCDKHGIYRQSFYHHNGGQRCLACSGKQQKTTAVFIRDAKKIHGGSYDYSKVDYKSAHTKVIIVCKIHGPWNVTPASHLKGNKCPHCKESRGEKEVVDFFKARGFVVKTQTRFDGCRGKRYPLPFDVFLPKLRTLIEYQGEQHWHVKKLWGGEKGLLHRIKLDKIKRDWALANGYRYIEVPYWYRTDPAGIAGFLDKKLAELPLQKAA